MQSDFWDFDMGSRRNVTIPDEFLGVSKFLFQEFWFQPFGPVREKELHGIFDEPLRRDRRQPGRVSANVNRPRLDVFIESLLIAGE